jgi:SAM-dependent methyltransferase
MLKAVWPGPQEQTICADWCRMPLPNASQDMVLCDGGLCIQVYPQGQQLMVAELARILAPGGLLFIRLFVLPEQDESVERVLEDLRSGGIPDLDQLKLRLWMALQQSPEQGISSLQLWDTTESAVPDFDLLGELLHIDAESLRGAAKHTTKSNTRYYSFADLATLENLFTGNPGGFTLEQTLVPVYPLGERCPTLVLRRK